jgi:hypothetical protein
MSRLVVQMQMSADGYVEAADPAVQWQVWDWGQNWAWDDDLKRDFNVPQGRPDTPQSQNGRGGLHRSLDANR